MARNAIRVTITRNRLPTIARILPEAARVIVDRHGRAMEATARRLVRVDTGALRDSITWRMTGDTEGELTAGEGLPDIRAAANEFGTRVMSAQPYLRPAVEQQRGPFLDAMADLERLLR